MNDFLETRFEKIRDDSEGDWPDVLRRVSKRGRRRRLTVLGAAVLGVVVLVPAALALRTTFIDFFQSEPAPQRLVLDFARQDVGAPPGLENHVIYEQTRKIFERRIDNGQVLTLWVDSSPIAVHSAPCVRYSVATTGPIRRVTRRLDERNTSTVRDPVIATIAP